jgi:hypothetical protein
MKEASRGQLASSYRLAETLLTLILYQEDLWSLHEKVKPGARVFLLQPGP